MELNTLSVRDAANLSHGQFGYELITDTNTHTGKWVAIYFIADTTFSSLVDPNRTGATLDSSLLFQANGVIEGTFTSITLATGAIFAYKGNQ